MANVDRPNGARAIGTMSGSPWQGAVREYHLDGTANDAAIAVGDFVVMTATGYLKRYAAGDVTTSIVGLVVGVGNQTANYVGGKAGDNFLSTGAVTLDVPGKNYVAASTAGVIQVCVAPDLLMEMQEDGDTDPLELIDIGTNCEITGGGPNTGTGISTMEIDSSEHSATVTDPIRIIGLAQTPGNELGDTASAAGRPTNARWVVAFNQNALHINDTSGI